MSRRSGGQPRSCSTRVRSRQLFCLTGSVLGLSNHIKWTTWLHDASYPLQSTGWQVAVGTVSCSLFLSHSSRCFQPDACVVLQ